MPANDDKRSYPSEDVSLIIAASRGSLYQTMGRKTQESKGL